MPSFWLLYLGSPFTPAYFGILLWMPLSTPWLQSSTFNSLTLFGNIRFWSLWPCKNLLNQAHILIYPANIRSRVKFWIFICGFKNVDFSQNTKPLHFTVWNRKHVMKGRCVLNNLKTCQICRILANLICIKFRSKTQKSRLSLNFLNISHILRISERQIVQNYL